MTYTKTKSILDSAQIFFWVLILSVPAIGSYLNTFDLGRSLQVLRGNVTIMLPAVITYFVNYLFLVPKCLQRNGRKWLFFVGNLLILAAIAVNIIVRINRIPVPAEVSEHFNRTFIALSSIITNLVIELFVISIAVAIHYIIRYYELKHNFEEEKRQTAEAELTWLKSQLNPHFLFNTLNNISSLTQIDPDKAQDSIGQLSDLLRYALYESNTELVPLSGEIDFMGNYIDLMSLRCNEMTKVNKEMDTPSKEIRIAPLLFISLIENAFKHGVNARYPSFVNISLKTKGRDLVFSCENSRFEKSGTDHIGSGIGLENLKRRLELIYPGAYDYDVFETPDKYTAKVVLKGIC